MFAPKPIAVAATLLMLSSGMAAAAPAFVAGDLNLRAGPTTKSSVLIVMPRGTTVDAYACGRYWCRVEFAGYSGFASTSYLDVGGPGYAAASPPPPITPLTPLALLGGILNPYPHY